MVDRAERDPTMEEIVVALRETQRAAGRAPHFTVHSGQRGRDPELSTTPDARKAGADATDIAGLRDREIQRLLEENALLNQRVVSLLRVLEHEHARKATRPASDITSRNAISREVKAALETELRPVLDVLLRLLETMRGAPPKRESAPSTACRHDAGIIDLDASPAHE